MVPSAIMVMLILIPAIMTALGVVREVETGSIANFRSTPVTRVEFLLGKQLPYVLIGVSSFATLVLLAIFVFGVPVTGSWAALIAGGFLCVCAATGFGLLVSTIVRTQVAAVFGTTCIALIPTVSFSGLLVPVSSLSGAGRVIGVRLSGVLLPADQRRRLHQGTRVPRALAQPPGARDLYRPLHRRGGARAPETGDLKCSGSCSTSSRWA